jgi:uncharacterized membrane protein
MRYSDFEIIPLGSDADERREPMADAHEDRINALEREVAALSERLRRLEAPTERRRSPSAASPSLRPPTPAAPSAPAKRAPQSAVTSPRRPALDLEELLGGRLLGLAGGVAVLVGLAFLVALALERGWLGETTRVVLAFLGSGALLAVGAWLYEKRGRTQAALAAVGTGIAGLYLSVTVSTSLYGLVPVALGLAVAFAVGTLATTLAVRWNSRTVAGLGIVGALLAPVLVEGEPVAGAAAFLAVALAASSAVLVWRRWEWLRVLSFFVVMPQVALWALDDRSAAVVVAGLAGFCVLELVAALGFELRVPAARLRPSTSLLVAVNALAVGGIGFQALADQPGGRWPGVWLLGVAVAHGAAGAAVLASRRTSREIGLLLLGVALTSADVAFGLLADGALLAVGWAASAAALGGLARRYTRGSELIRMTLGGQLALAAGHALFFEASPDGFSSGFGDLGGASAALVAIALSAFACARAATRESEIWRTALDAVSLLTLAYLTGVVLDGPTLVLAWAGEAIALAQLARIAKARVAGIGSLGFLGLAALHVLTYEVPPRALAYGVEDVGAAALALGGVAAAAFRCSRLRPAGVVRERGALELLAAASVFYLASTAIVDAFQPGSGAIDAGLGLDVRQQGQALLSAFWSVSGLGALWLGLRRRARELRLAGFGLLTLALAKVSLYDLSVLESEYRVLSFIVLGLLLLAAAFAYQRTRTA